MKENRGGSSFSSFLMGGLIGAAVALLMAPRTGEETRSLLRDKSYEIKDKTMEKGYELKDKATEKVDETRSNLNDTFNSLRRTAAQAIETKKDEVSDIEREGRARVAEEKDRISNIVDAAKDAANQ